VRASARAVAPYAKTSALAAATEKVGLVEERERLWRALVPKLRALRRRGVPYAEVARVATEAGYPVSCSTVWRRLREGQ
jgi:hypothetical protein